MYWGNLRVLFLTSVQSSLRPSRGTVVFTRSPLTDGNCLSTFWSGWRGLAREYISFSEFNKPILILSENGSLDPFLRDEENLPTFILNGRESVPNPFRRRRVGPFLWVTKAYSLSSFFVEGTSSSSLQWIQGPEHSYVFSLDYDPLSGLWENGSGDGCTCSVLNRRYLHTICLRLFRGLGPWLSYLLRIPTSNRSFWLLYRWVWELDFDSLLSLSFSYFSLWKILDHQIPNNFRSRLVLITTLCEVVRSGQGYYSCFFDLGWRHSTSLRNYH